jgi:LysR family transcriptional activator of nhaA
MLPFNFHHFYYFYVTARTGSVSQAAQELRLSQPALSTQIKHLEDFLQVKLFERTSRKMELTEEGRLALHYAQQVFDAGKEFADSLRDRSQKGRLKIQIGVLNSIPKAFANALLKFLLSKEPSTYIQLHEENLESMTANLKDHVLDFIFADRPVQTSAEEEIQSHLIAKIPIVFCAHPALAKKYKKVPRDLNGAPMIFPTADSRVFYSVQEYLAGAKVTPRIVAEIQDIELSLRMALDGLGILPLNKAMASKVPKSKLVILEETSGHGLHESLYIISKKRKKPHPLVETTLREFSL